MRNGRLGVVPAPPTSAVDGVPSTVSFTPVTATEQVGNDTVTACVTVQGAPLCGTAGITWITRLELSVNDVSVVEGDTGTEAAVFTVTLNTPVPAGLLRVSTGSLTASTDQTPDMLEPTARPSGSTCSGQTS